MTSLAISVDEAKIIARPASRRAFVAINPAIFGMGRLMEAYHEMSDVASQVRLFYDLLSALK